ncbi:MAG: hypothetical protein ACLP7Q_01045 [Isosphaeraceae bacterium]
MRLGFVSAIVPEYTFKQVLSLACKAGFASAEPYPKPWHTPKIPGLGDVNWGSFVGASGDTGYAGDVAIEVEDRAFEGSLESRRDALHISRRYLPRYIQG